MLKKLTINSMAALTLLSTAVMASDSPRYPSSEMFLGPLAKRSCALQAQASNVTLAFERLEGDLKKSLSSEQLRMQSALQTLNVLCPEADQGFCGVSYASMNGTDLEIVVSGNAQNYPEFLEALLTAEINDPFYQGLMSTYRNGAAGWMHYAACALADAPKVKLIQFLARQHSTSFDVSENNGFINSSQRFPIPAVEGGIMDVHLEAELHGTLISDYIRREIAGLYEPFNSHFLVDEIESLFERLTLYMVAALKLQAEIKGEFDFHAHSLKALMDIATLSIPSDKELSKAERMYAVLMNPETNFVSFDFHTKETNKAKEQLGMLSPIVDLIESVADLMKRSGKIS